MKPLVLVGKRSAAIEAARKLGHEPLVVTVPGRAEQAEHAFGGHRQEALALAKDLLKGRQPCAVVGVAEGSVPVAAELRAHFGLAGITPTAARLAHDKLAMKRAIAGADIPCAPWAEVTESTNASTLGAQLGYPLVLKLPISSGGRGVKVIRDLTELESSLAPGLLAEGFIRGAEMSVESYRLRGRTLLQNTTRYLNPGWASLLPAGLDAAALQKVNELTLQVHHALDLSDGMTHMEIFLTASGPVFGEIAARPPGGRLMNLLALAYGFHPWEALLEIALGKDPQLPSGPERHAAAHILFPPPGRLIRIEGLDEARALPGVAEVKCHARPGEIIDPRGGTGEIKGHVLVTAADEETCAARLAEATAKIHFEMA